VSYLVKSDNSYAFFYAIVPGNVVSIRKRRK
jgi:hypothetical protein